MSANDGGPAFPAPWVSIETDDPSALSVSHTYGMSLRDYFAAAALPITPTIVIAHPPQDGAWTEANVAKWAYRVADAMLAERVCRTCEGRGSVNQHGEPV